METKGERRLKNLSGSNLFRSILLSYIIVLVIPMLLSGFTYIAISSEMKQNVNDIERLTLNQFSRNVDGFMQNGYRICSKISLDKKFKNIAAYERGEKGYFNPLQLENIKTAQNELNLYRLANPEIVNVYVIYDNFAINPSGIMAPDYLDTILEYDEDDARFWNNPNYRDSFLIEGKNNLRHIYLTQQIIDNGGQRGGVVVAEIRYATVEAMFAKLRWKNGQNFFIATKNSSSIDVYENEELADFFNKENEGGYQFLINAGSNESMNIGGEKSVVLHTASTELPWIYGTVIPSGEFWSSISTLRNVWISQLTLCVIFGGFLVMYFAKKQYSPIKRISELYVESTGNKKPRSIENYQSLEEGMEYLLEGHRLAQNLQKHREGYIRFLQSQIVSGSINLLVNHEEIVKEYGLDIDKQQVMAVIFSLEKLSHPDFIHEGEKTSENLMLFALAMENILYDLGANVFVAPVNNELVGIFWQEDNKSPGLYESTEKSLLELEKLMLEYFKADFIFFAGNIHKGMNGVPESYAEALRIKEIIRYSGMEKKVVTSYRSFEKEAEKDISSLFFSPFLNSINCIRVRDYSGAREHMKAIANSFGQQLSLPSGQVGDILLVAKSMLRTVVDESCPGTAAEALADIDYPACIENAESLNQLVGLFYTLMDRLEAEQEAECSRLSPWVIKVDNYIADNYSRFDLSVQEIADYVAMNVSYLSREYKKQQNIGVLEKIHRVRLAHARDLVLNGATFEQAASQSGFIDVRSLKRVAKKYYGSSEYLRMDTRKASGD